jgi:hypothetical protein
MGLKDNVKPNFVHLATPDQLQFYNWMDWIRWNDEEVPMADITGLINALLQKADLNLVRPEEMNIGIDSTFLMPAKYKLESIAIKNNTATAMNIAINNNPGNIINDYEVEVPANGMVDLEIGKTFWVETELFISGVTGSIDVLIFRK